MLCVLACIVLVVVGIYGVSFCDQVKKELRRQYYEPD
jgi:hypothetical protein